MKSHHTIITLILLILFTFAACQSKEANPSEENTTSTLETAISNGIPEESFPIPPIPVMMTNPEEIMNYLSEHFWDLYNFADTTLIHQPDITEQGLVDYIELLNQLPVSNAKRSINIMLDKAKPHPTMYNHFAELYEKYLYDPNSPFRNEELYIPIAQHLIASGLLSNAKHEVCKLQLEMAQKNRVGTTATDFTYTLANGDKNNMHSIQSSYLILFFTNPDCPACASTTEQIANSKALQGIFALNSINHKMLTVLSIYPDASVDEWRKALPTLPQKHWINSYDDGEIIINKRLYDLKAIPTLYLLDKDKKVVLKDVTLREIEVYFIEIR